MMFKFQWKIEKHFPELEMRPGFVLNSTIEDSKLKAMILHDEMSREEVLHKRLSM